MVIDIQCIVATHDGHVRDDIIMIDRLRSLLTARQTRTQHARIGDEGHLKSGKERIGVWDRDPSADQRQTPRDGLWWKPLEA